MRNKLFFCVIFLFSVNAFSQKEKLIQGKIQVKSSKLDGIRVINLVNEKEAISDADGVFSILAKPDDLLVFSAPFLDYMRKIVDITDYNKGAIEIEMTSKVVQLDEVEIHDYSRINAVELGILSSPAKEYTPAERRLKTASDLYPTLDVGMWMGGSIGLDPLMNWISGRTAMLKRALKAEEKEILLQKLEMYFTEEFYTEKLQIQDFNLISFKNFAIYDALLINAINTNNEAQMEFNLYRLFTEFKKLNDYEN